MNKIALCMMVKNEEETIIRTLKSCKDVIDRLFLLDTGSTDDTVKVASNFCSSNGIKFNVTFSDFKYFGPTRNKLLEFSEKEIPADSLYMVLDANDELRYHNLNFLADIEKLSLDTDINCVYVRSEWLDINRNITDHDKIFLIKSGRGIRYKGYCHEDLMYTNPKYQTNMNNKLESVHIYQDRLLEDDRSAKRLEQDIEYIKQEIIDYKDDIGQLNRSYYFIGRIYASKGDYENASFYLNKLFDLKANNPTFPSFNGELFYMAHYTYTFVLEKTRKPWHEQMEHLLKAYSYNKDKIEALVGIINYYCDIEEYSTAYIFSKYVCKVPFVKSCTNMMIHYNFSRWCLHAIICVKLNKIKEGKKAFDKMDRRNIPRMYENHYQQLSEIYNFMNDKVNKKIILIFGGYSLYKWDPSMLFYGVSLGGSETVITYNALHLSRMKDLKVVVCCDCEKEVEYEGISIIPINKFDLFISLYKIDTLIVHRFIEYLRFDENVSKCILVLEDVLPAYINTIGQCVVSFYTKPDTTFNYNSKLKSIVFKTNWHLEYNKLNTYTRGIPREVFKVIGNGIDTTRFTKFSNQNIPRTKYRFIYTSSSTRGALRIANMIPKILEIIPEATFYFFMDLNPSEIVNPLSKYSNVFLSERIDQEQLAIEIMKSDIWLYPTNFCETYCITALEMQIGGVFCICSQLAGLNETVGDRGILVENFNSDDSFIDVIRDLHNNKIPKNLYLERAFNWALKQDWKYKVQELSNNI